MKHAFQSLTRGVAGLWQKAAVAGCAAFALAANPAGAQVCAPAPGGLISWWAGENNAMDSVGGNSGVLQNGAGFAPGLVGRAFNFNGINQYVAIPNSANLNPGGSFSIEAWIYVAAATGGGEVILGKWGAEGDFSNQRSYTFEVTPDFALEFGITDEVHQNDAAFHAFISGSGVVPQRAWVHVAAVYDQTTGTRRLYANGVEVAERTDPPITIFNGSAGVGIGAEQASSTTGAGPFDGLIDEVSLYGRALLATEIQAIYQAGGAGKCAASQGPVITGQPASQSVMADASVSFSVAATGQAPLRYQWQFNGADLAGQSNAILNLTNVQPVNSGLYDVIVGNAAGSTTSLVVTLTVGVLPQITLQPQDQTTTNGGNASFSVTATGTGALAYQWYFDGGVLATQTNRTLSLSGVSLSQAGAYRVLVSDTVGPVLSAIAALTIGGPSQCVEPPAGLISWWTAEGNGTDTYGTNSGVLRNGAGYAMGEAGLAFNFNGANQYLAISNSASLNPPGSFSIEAWINLRQATNGGQVILGKWGASGDFLEQRSYTFEVTPGLGLEFGITDAAHQDDAAFHAFVSSNNVVPTNAWMHVAAVYDQATGTRRIYTNGVELAERTDPPITIFAGTAGVGIGAEQSSSTNSAGDFNGLIDEVSLYGRALAGGELLAIYNAGSAGKCAAQAPPVIATQPQSQTTAVLSSASFSVLAAGTGPLNYQWLLNGAPLAGASNSTLSLSPVQSSEAGIYSVVVTNAYGSVTSSNATLTVTVPSCTPVPSGAVSWWQAEGTAADFFGVNPGILRNGAGFAAGEVGQGFSLDGTSQYVEIADSPSLNPSAGFSIEAWIYLAGGSSGVQTIFGKWGDQDDYFNQRCYTLCILPQNVLQFAITDLTNQWNTSFHQFNTITNAITPGVWSHVAAVYDQASGTRRMYINGVEVAERTDAPITVLNADTKVGIGARFTSSTEAVDLFGGGIDEPAFYSRALSAAEVLSIYNSGSLGKCQPQAAPMIVTQPQNQTANSFASVTFGVGAGGTGPLSYQWLFNGSAIAGATSPVLTLTNVQGADAGVYAVTVTNLYGSAASSNATLTVIPPPSLIQVVSVTATSGVVVVPINLVARGTENALGFSIDYDPGFLTFAGASLGSGATNGSLFFNDNQVAGGRLGVAVTLPSSATFPAGTQELVEVSFFVSSATNPTVTTVSFGDVPTGRQVSDPEAVALAASYTAGTVTIPYLGFEADVSPVPGGDGVVTITDWVQVGRYVAGLDTVTNAAEFQRADCAPRSTFGNGSLTVADWVQAGRYAVGLDPLTIAGGPTTDLGGPGVVKAGSPGVGGFTRDNLSPRVLRVVNASVLAAQTAQVSVQLDAQGNENALGFSLLFDPAVVSLTGAGATLGAGASTATLTVNTNDAAQGKLGVLLGLPFGKAFTNGTFEVLKLNLAVAATASGSTNIAFANGPVTLETVDAGASTLTTAYENGVVAIVPLAGPTLRISRSAAGLVLTWPAAATAYGVETTTDLAANNWTSVATSPTPNGTDVTATIPFTGTQRYYRLHQP